MMQRKFKPHPVRRFFFSFSDWIFISCLFSLQQCWSSVHHCTERTQAPIDTWDSYRQLIRGDTSQQAVNVLISSEGQTSSCCFTSRRNQTAAESSVFIPGLVRTNWTWADVSVSSPLTVKQGALQRTVTGRCRFHWSFGSADFIWHYVRLSWSSVLQGSAEHHTGVRSPHIKHSTNDLFL